MRNRNPFFQILLIVLAVAVLVWWFRRAFPSLTEPSAPVSEAVPAHVGPPDIYPDPARRSRRKTFAKLSAIRAGARNPFARMLPTPIA
jgi:hypothetical protein